MVLAKSSYNASFAVHVNGGWSGSVTGGNGETSMDKNFKSGTRFAFRSGRYGGMRITRRRGFTWEGSKCGWCNINKKLRKWSGIGFAKER